jgi:hypothetical protein
MTIINCAILALDKYPAPSTAAISTFNIMNLGLTVFFLMEMAVLLIALGFGIYFQDPYNTIDAMIVTLSCVEFVISLFQGGNVIEDLGSGGVLATFRVFRTFRVLKLINNWKKLRLLLTTAVSVIKDMRYFMLILFVYLLVAS